MKKYNKKGMKNIIKKYNNFKEYINSSKFEAKYVSECETIQNAMEDWNDDEDNYIYRFDTMAIKSPYGSGKTYMLKEIIKTGKYQKIAYISYRRSLEQQIHKEFREFKFNHYLEKPEEIANADRLIIQIDSILKMGEYYDLIILDELESVLNHITSSLIDNEYLKSQKIFQKLRSLCDNSRKIICLDGDLSTRSEDFIKCINKEYKIFENTIKETEKKYIEINHFGAFTDEIDKAIERKEKIVIVSQSAKKAQQFYDYISNKGLKVAIYTGKTDDLKKKEALENIENWKNLDCLIYSPTIESGVNFDLEHFDRMFIITSPRSCSFRSLSQMEKRVRYLKNNEIIIYINANNKGLNYEFSFNEIKEDYKRITEKTEEELKPYDILKIHNEREKMNNQYFFFHSYKKIGKSKNKIFSNYEMPEILMFNNLGKVEKMDMKILDNNEKIDIDLLISKQKKGEASSEDKEYLKKYILCRHLGLNYKELTIKDKKQIIEYEDKISNIYNHLALNDDKYIKNYLNMINNNDKNYDINKQYKKVETIRAIIKELNISNIYEHKIIDRKTIESENMIKLINNYKILIMDKRKTNGKLILLTLNNILSNYCLFISNEKRGTKLTFKPHGDIEEIVKRRNIPHFDIDTE